MITSPEYFNYFYNLQKEETPFDEIRIWDYMY